MDVAFSPDDLRLAKSRCSRARAWRLLDGPGVRQARCASPSGEPTSIRSSKPAISNRVRPPGPVVVARVQLPRPGHHRHGLPEQPTWRSRLDEPQGVEPTHRYRSRRRRAEADLCQGLQPPSRWRRDSHTRMSIDLDVHRQGLSEFCRRRNSTIGDVAAEVAYRSAGIDREVRRRSFGPRSIAGEPHADG